MSKITKATFKAFIKKNKENLFILHDSDFNGMYDGVELLPDAKFNPARESKSYKNYEEHTLGFEGIYLVGQSRDWFKEYDDGIFKGIYWYNCCGSGAIAIKK